jgi:hypothetical protein
VVPGGVVVATFPTTPDTGTGGLTSPVAIADGGTGATTAIGAAAALDVKTISAGPYVSNPVKILKSPLSGSGQFILLTGVAYFVYLGRVERAITVERVLSHLVVLAGGTVAVEMGLASSPTPPDGTSKTMTKIIATSTVDSLTVGLAVKGATNSFAQAIPAGTHLWAMVRSSYSSTQPTFRGLFTDMGMGYVLTTAASGVLTDAGPWTGVVATFANSAAIGPDLQATVS